ncbi:MAG TPA: hypothetical protein VFX49_20490 [Chloroflexota bacterium]|nr:hypothetical protein [Chloroflexota bacterium]
MSGAAVARFARTFFGAYALAYALLGVLLVASYWTLWIWHQAAAAWGRVWFPWKGDRPASDTVYLLTMTVTGIVLFLFVAIAEGYLRSAARDGRPLRVCWAFLKLAVVQAMLAVAGGALFEVVLRRA